MRHVCVVTGSRAEFGLVRPTLTAIQNSAVLCPKLVVTGTHLSSFHGGTKAEIEAAGMLIDAEIPMDLTSDDRCDVTASLAAEIASLSRIFSTMRPWLVLLVGDRFETFGAATAAFLGGIPIAHCHGGETTLGSFDNAFRNSITHMATLHFVSNEVHRERVIALGADSNSVHVVGALGLDSIDQSPVFSPSEITERLGVVFGSPNFLVTMHPETAIGSTSDAGVGEMLSALAEFQGAHFVFTAPNADPGSKKISAQLARFIENRENAWLFPSLGQSMYLSVVRQVDVVVGNSSSGLIEAPSLGVPSVNIGARQQDRMSSPSVIHCRPNSADIGAALRLALSEKFRLQARRATNVYGSPGAASRIVKVLEDLPIQF